MLSEARLPAACGIKAGRHFAPIDEYERGFARSLVLRTADGSGKYSRELEKSLENYFESYGVLNHPKLSDWRIDHLGGRVAHAFNTFIPWCQELSVNFGGARILEIGCGTGSSTVALAAYGESVVACDIHAPSIEVARLRLRDDGFAHKVEFVLLGPESSELLQLTDQFDVCVLYGVLEHMLPPERERMFAAIWKLLREKGKIVIYETPNRLWPRDRHTTDLLGWSWLSPKLALKYGKWRGRLDRRLDEVGMCRLGYGLTYRELLRLLRGTKVKIRHKYTREPFYQRVMIKGLTNLFGAPRWGFSEYLNLIIEKV